MKKRTSYYCDNMYIVWIPAGILFGVFPIILLIMEYIDKDSFLYNVLIGILGVGFLGCGFATFWLCRIDPITAFHFYDNKFFVCDAKFKYSQVQIVTLSLPRILCLKTQNQTIVCECDLKGWSDLKIKQILSEFEKRGKKIEIDESLYNIF